MVIVTPGAYPVNHPEPYMRCLIEDVGLTNLIHYYYYPTCRTGPARVEDGKPQSVTFLQMRRSSRVLACGMRKPRYSERFGKILPLK